MKTVAGMDSSPSDVVMSEIPLMEPGAAVVPYHHAELNGTHAAKSTTDDPFPTLFRETAMDPDRFNGKIVTIRGRVKIAFEDFELSTTECKGREIDSIWLEYGKGPKKQPTIWC
jgi:hypothetical protein